MSPEQCRGLNDEVDGTTDVYALGCILYEMLCGKAPFVSPGWGDVLMMHMQDAIPVPSAENPRVPAAVDQVVTTALAKNKADRYASMRDMHRALAQARGEVEDTPAPMHRTDPALPAIVLGVDRAGQARLAGRCWTRCARWTRSFVPQLRPRSNRDPAGRGGRRAGAGRRLVAIVLVVAAAVGEPRGGARARPSSRTPRRRREPSRRRLPVAAAPTTAPALRAGGEGKRQAPRHRGRRSRATTRSKRRDPVKW